MPSFYRNSDLQSIGNPIIQGPNLEEMGTVGDRVREVRAELGWSQEKLAKKAKMKQSSLSELENGQTRETPQIVKLALALGVSAYWLDSGKGPKKLKELEQAVLELPESEQRVIMGVIRATITEKV